MTKEKFLKAIVYILLAGLILLFILSVVAPEKFELLLSLTNTFLQDQFALKGWLIVVASFLSLLGCIQLILFMASFRTKKLPYHKYRHDNFKETLWRWSWNEHHIENLWCYCPECNQELSYSCDHLLFKTEFFCQKCEKKLCSYDGDNINYVLSKIKREIRRLAQKQFSQELKKS